MNSLESRKLLLIAESELNRAQLAEEWRTIAGDVRSITGQARTVSTLALAAASLVTGLVAFRRVRSSSAGGKNPWWQTLLKGAHLLGTLWLDSRPRPKS
jgi:hypothetical protein